MENEYGAFRWMSMTSNVSGPNNIDVQPYTMPLQTAIDLTAKWRARFSEKNNNNLGLVLTKLLNGFRRLGL